ncbi:MAG: epimerase, partial [Candidatus Omnitrophica bacterium]|nr:epimerase [Candidatus Omnitrophota bacterium]
SYILRKKPLLPVQTARFSRLSLAFDNSKAKKELGFKVTPIEESFKKTVEWYKENGYIKSN